MNLVDRAAAIALQAHNGQVNNHDGEAYILHVHRVFTMVRDAGLPDRHQAVAWLHDVLEDTPVTIRDLAEEFDATLTSAVVALTKVKGESNEDYYSRVRTNSIATAVKIQDINDNFGRNHTITDEATRLRMQKKYSLGVDMLTRKH